MRICTRGRSRIRPEDTYKSLSPLARPETAIAFESQIDPWSAHAAPYAVQFRNDRLIKMHDFTADCRNKGFL